MAVNKKVRDETLKRKGEDLRIAGFTNCVCPDGRACAGAGAIKGTLEARNLSVTCGTRGGSKPVMVPFAEAQVCSKRTKHKK